MSFDKLLYIVLCFECLFSLNISGQNDGDKNMLEPSFLPQIAQHKGKFYIISQSNNFLFRKTLNLATPGNSDSMVVLYEFIPKGNVIKQLAIAEFNRTFFGTTAVGNKIYIAGGYDNKGIPTKNLYEYDLISRKWTEKTEMFMSRAKFALEYVNGKIYAIGGEGLKTSVEYYDPANDLWEILDFKRIPSNLKPIDIINASAVIEDKIYLLGSNGTTFQIFIPSQSLLSEGPATPINSEYFDMLVVNKKLYVAAGGNQTSIDISIYLYDAVEGIWSNAGFIPLPRFGSGLAFFDKTIVFIGGSVNNRTQPVSPIKEIFLYRPMK